MPIRVKINVKKEKHNPKSFLAKYRKDLQDVLKKVGQEGVKSIQHEIKKRNLTETEDLVSFEVSPQGLSFTIDYEKLPKASETKVPEKLGEAPETTLLEEVPPETVNKMFQVASHTSIRQGFKKGLEKTREKLIAETRKLHTKIIANV